MIVLYFNVRIFQPSILVRFTFQQRPCPAIENTATAHVAAWRVIRRVCAAPPALDAAGEQIEVIRACADLQRKATKPCVSW